MRWTLLCMTLLAHLTLYSQSGEYHVIDGIPQTHLSYSLKCKDGTIVLLDHSYFHDTVNIQRIDSFGNIVMTKTIVKSLDIKSGNEIYGSKMFNSFDGGFLLLFPTFEKIFSDSVDLQDQNIGLAKFDAQLNLLWKKKFGGKGGNPTVSAEWSNSLVEKKNGMIYIYGVSWAQISGNKTSPNYGSTDGWLLKLDANGNKIWDKSYGGSADEFYSSVVDMTDTSLLLLSSSRSSVSGTRTLPNTAREDLLIYVVDTNGSILREEVKFPNYYNIYLNQSLKTQDNGVLVHINDKLIKLNSNLDSIWSVEPISIFGYRNQVIDVSNDGRIVASLRIDTLKLLKLDLNGNILWNQVFLLNRKPFSYSSIENVIYFNDQFIINMWWSNLKNEYQVGDTARDTSFLLWLSKEPCKLNPSIVKTDSTLVCLQTKVNYQWLSCDSAMKPIPTETAQSYRPQKSGRYACILQKGICVDTTVCISFTFIDSCTQYPVSTKILKSDSGMLCEEANSIYQWMTCDSGKYRPISNEVKRNYQPLKDGLYAVDISRGRCRDTSNCVYYIRSGVSSVYADQWEVYPNPVSVSFYIIGDMTDNSIQLSNLLGQKVPILINKDNQYDVSKLENGIYMLEIRDKNGVAMYMEKLVVEK